VTKRSKSLGDSEFASANKHSVLLNTAQTSIPKPPGWCLGIDGGSVLIYSYKLKILTYGIIYIKVFKQ